MKQLKYKVEAFIVPVGNSYSTHFRENNVQIKEDDINNVIVSIRQNKSNHTQDSQNDSFSMEEENTQNLKNCEATGKALIETEVDTNDFDENRAVNFCSSLHISPIKYEKLVSKDSACYTANVIQRVQKLTPIDERNEDEHTDLCYHGCKNGCSATVPTPQEVSEKIFKESWLQKLEDIKQRESILRSREIILLNHEKALLKKEKELKTLECVLKDKLKQIEFNEKNHLHPFKVDASEMQKDSLVSLIDIDTKQISEDKLDTNNDSEEELNDLDINKLDLCTKNTETQDTLHEPTEQLHKSTRDTEVVDKELCEERTSFIYPTSSSLDSLLTEKKIKQLTNARSYVTSKSSHFRSTSDNNSRVKRSCKIYYEDLDTTLSADIGDSSFVQTSQKFNPALYKKPYAFRRTTSERRVKYMNRKSTTTLEVEDSNSQDEKLQTPIGIEQDKVLKKVTQNIFASKDKSTKFQHYGLIDENVSAANKVCTIENEERYSYLNLETNNKSSYYQKLEKDLNYRPVSWNEHTNEWLRKKRHAYNMTINKVHTDNKENVECNNMMKDRLEIVLKKKDLKSRIFTLFR